MTTWRIRRYDELGSPEPVLDFTGGEVLRQQFHMNYWCQVVKLGSEIYLVYLRPLLLLEVRRAARTDQHSVPRT